MTAHKRPAMLPLCADGIPEAMRQAQRWVVWSLVWKADKGEHGGWDKPPLMASCPNRYADSTDPETWDTFEVARAAVEDGKADGAGFVLGDGWVGADWDHCVNPQTGEIDPAAAEDVRSLNTYAERSPLQEGIHAIGRGTLPAGGRKKGPQELYDGGRYFTMTGHVLPDAPRHVAERTAEFHALHARIFGNGNGRRPAEKTATRSAAEDLDDAALLGKAEAAVNGARFAALWAGDTSAYPSHSEADAAFLALLAFWTGRDAARMDRLFRQSGLMREKWDSQRGSSTYGEQEIDKAIDRCVEVYSGPMHGSTRAEARSDPATSARDTEEPDAKPAATTLPVLDAGDGNLPRISRRAADALEQANDPPQLFRYGGLPVRLEHDERGAPIVRPLTEDRCRGHLARAADWRISRKSKPGADPVWVSAFPPMAVVRDLLAQPELPLPVLERIVEAPCFTATGALHTTAGYRRESRLFFAPAPGLDIPAVPSRPNIRQVEEARELLYELLQDFPFVTDAERAHAIALFLLPFVRDLVDGPTPLNLVEKPAPGTGATLLVESLLWPAIGRPVGALTEGRDEDEWRKRMTAKLLTSPPAVVIDNLRRPLESSAFSAAITSTVWEDRQLGGSSLVRVPVRCAFIATGNNPRFSNEITRRTIRIRLDAGVERPWLRERFHHPNLRAWVAEHRGSLVAAALTLGQAWIAAGRPEGRQTMGMFESWAHVLGGVLEVAEVPGFLSNLEEFYEASDADADAWAALAERWREQYDGRAIGVGQLWALVNPADGSAALDLPLGDGSERSQRTRLGNLIKGMRRRVFSGFRIEAAGKLHGGRLWRLDRV